MTWQHRRWDELTRDELHAILMLRQRVFVVEHRRVCLDVDGADPLAWHLWHGDDVRAYLRWFPPGIRGVEANFGRVVTAPEVRGTGLGRALVAEGLARILAHHGATPIRITAQRYLEAFYAGYGFVRASDVAVIDGIDHVEMRRP